MEDGEGGREKEREKVGFTLGWERIIRKERLKERLLGWVLGRREGVGSNYWGEVEGEGITEENDQKLN